MLEGIAQHKAVYQKLLDITNRNWLESEHSLFKEVPPPPPALGAKSAFVEDQVKGKGLRPAPCEVATRLPSNLSPSSALP